MRTLKWKLNRRIFDTFNNYRTHDIIDYLKTRLLKFGQIVFNGND